MQDAFQSSDSARHARALRYAQTALFDEPFQLEGGAKLPSITVAYETYGQLTPEKDNAILVGHALSGDSHVAKHDPADDPGWWDIMVGPGKPVDTNRFFVICPNLLGGCRGTTGPSSIDPTIGKPYGPNFPTVTVGDMVEVQRKLIDHLGIRRLLAVVGGSIGGHQALTWATRFPDRVQTTLLLATSARLTSQALAFDVVGRNAIRRDPHYHGGQYYDYKHGPEVGLAIARMIGHITYLSREAMTQKFEATRLQPRNVATEFEKIFSVGSYLGYQGTRFVERFDANSYIVLSMALDLFDLGGAPAKLQATLKPTRCRWLVLSFSSDWLFPPEQSQDIVKALIANQAQVSYCNVQSACGHDAFLLADDFARYGEMVRAFLNQIAPPSVIELTKKIEEERAAHDPTSIFQPRRLDYDRIIELIPPGASVLDLGCGNGRLLARLKKANHRRLVGVELDEHKIINCLNRGLDVIQADLNKGLRAFADQEFECVVLSQTLPAVLDVGGVIADMLRVGRTCIVSFPNLAFHKLRQTLAVEGRAPGTSAAEDRWYNTPAIRFLSIADFEEYCAEKQIHIQRRIALDTEAGTEVFKDPNLNANLAIFVISRNGSVA